MFYAMLSHYNIGTAAHGDMLLRFESRKCRDEWVESDVFRDGGFHRSELTREEARHMFPAAFKCDTVVNATECNEWVWSYGNYNEFGQLVPWVPGMDAQAWAGLRERF